MNNGLRYVFFSYRNLMLIISICYQLQIRILKEDTMLFNTLCQCESPIRFVDASVNVECINCGHSNIFADAFQFLPTVTVEDQYSRARFKCKLATKFKKVALPYFTNNSYEHPDVFFEELKTSRAVN